MVNEVGEMDSVSPDDHNNSGISVFEIDSPDYKLNFLSWILDITQEEADKGFEFLKRNNKSIEVLWDPPPAAKGTAGARVRRAACGADTRRLSPHAGGRCALGTA